MDKINFSNRYTPYQELQLARWYTCSCFLIALTLIGMCSIYVIQWRTYQHAIHNQRSHAAHHALQQEYDQLLSQQKEREQSHMARAVTYNQLMTLKDSLAQDISLAECAITREGTNLTIVAPSRQRAQECVALLNKKQHFGSLALASIKANRQGEKSQLLVIIKAAPNLK